MTEDRRVLLPAETEEWGTPLDLFRKLDARYNFSIDLAATGENRMVPRYYSKTDSALNHAWEGERAFCNPPYDHRSLYVFTGKAFETWGGPKVGPHRGFGVFLVPCKTDQPWWHEHVWEDGHPRSGVAVHFIRGRLKYRRPGKRAGAGFPSALVIFGHPWRQ
jgi:phage N-6-adenine-methyltransferase